MILTPEIHTKRLLLRQVEENDAEAIYAWTGDIEVCRYLFYLPNRDLETTRKIVGNWVRKRRHFAWLLTLNGTPIGEFEIIKDLPGKGFEIGYEMAKAYWGNGYMKEAGEAVLSFMKEQGYAYAYAETDMENVSSTHLLEKLGFEVIGEETRLIEKVGRMVRLQKYQKAL
jgi:ribosomal-protein-alanine N-acetyltransferase